MMAHQSDVIIVGGGHNGLVCAFYLARAGLSVTVLERRDVVGVTLEVGIARLVNIDRRRRTGGALFEKFSECSRG